MSNLLTANREWSSRPADERFVSLDDMSFELGELRQRSTESTAKLSELEAVVVETNDVALRGPNGGVALPSHWAFGQIASLASAPAAYLRRLPAELACANLNYGLRRASDEQGFLVTKSEGGRRLRAVTGPKYGRVWNSQVCHALRSRFGDGVSGEWRVPGEFGIPLAEVTKANTTLFAGDRDMFVFLADEERRVDLPNRRAGRMGTFARGFFVWNSEVGSRSLGIAAFLYDYVCCNRIIWNVQEFSELTIRHTSNAPDRFITEASPILLSYANSATAPMLTTIEDARSAKMDETQSRKLLLRQFTAPQVNSMEFTHLDEEGRPIESLWDAVVAATAYARSIKWQDERVSIERAAGDLLKLAA